MQGLHVDLRFRVSLRGITEHPGRALQKLIAPLLDLVRMHVKVLGQLDQGLFALDCGNSDFRLE